MDLEQMTDAQLTAHYERLQQQALTEMRTDATGVAERLRAGGASEDQIAATFQRAGIAYPRVDFLEGEVGQVPAQRAHAEIPSRARTGTTTLPSGRIPPRAINPAPSRLGYKPPPSVGQRLPDAVIDDQILKQNFKRK